MNLLYLGFNGGGITPRIHPNFGQHARMQECRFRAFIKFQTFLQVCTNCKMTQGRLLTMLSKNFTDIRSDAFTQIIRHFNSWCAFIWFRGILQLCSMKFYSWFLQTPFYGALFLKDQKSHFSSHQFFSGKTKMKIFERAI